MVISEYPSPYPSPTLPDDQPPIWSIMFDGQFTALSLSRILKQAREKVFNKCMFKNIKPNSNAAHRRIVKNYCNDQAGE